MDVYLFAYVCMLAGIHTWVAFDVMLFDDVGFCEVFATFGYYIRRCVHLF